MNGRGFFGIGVYHPKREVNVGGIWRSAHLFGASFTFTVGARYTHRQSADTTDFRRHAPLYHYADLGELVRHLPHGSPLVGVELDPRATTLTAYAHRPAAVYLLGAEDHGLPPDVLDLCHDLVQIESVESWSMNVASAATVLLHHRLTTTARSRTAPFQPEGARHGE